MKHHWQRQSVQQGVGTRRAAVDERQNHTMPSWPFTDPSSGPMTDAPRFERLSQGLRQGAFAAIPGDWQVLLTDVEGSSQAIDKGRYKMVNALGAASIIAACNAVGRDDLPYVFGGDGASLLVPPESADRIESALRSLQAHATRAIGLRMRVGRVSIAEIRAAGADVRVGWRE
jgi:hypothetical protein